MPFASEKQRRYLHANEPELAKEWEMKYSSGDMANAIRKKKKKKKTSASNQGGASIGGAA